jgi:hypothetical protein
MRYLASYCVYISLNRLAEMTYLFSCSSVVEHCAYEVTLASQWSAVQTCPGEFFLGFVAYIAPSCPFLINQFGLLHFSFQGDENGWRSDLRDVHTRRQEARPPDTTTHTA